MKRLALIFLVPFNLWATTPQQMIGGGNGGAIPSVSATSTSQIYGSSGGVFDATVDRNTGIQAVPGTWSNMKICLNTPPGSAKSYTFTAQLGARNQDSTITCSISGTTQTCCEDVTHSSTTAAGDLFRIKSVPSGTPTGSTALTTSMLFTPTNDNNFIVAGAQTGQNAAANTYVALAGATGSRITQRDMEAPMSLAGTFDLLYAEVAAAPGVGKSWTITMTTNGSDSTVTCAISGTNTKCNDVTHSSATIRGDRVTWKVVPSGTPTTSTLSIGMRFTPTNRGEFPIIGNTFSAISNTASSYTRIAGGNDNSATENLTTSTTTSRSPGLIVKNGNYSVSTAPSAGKSYTYTLRRNFTDPTGGPSATISGTSTTAQSNGYVVVADGDVLTTRLTPSGTPTAGMFHSCYTGFYTQPSIIPVFP